MSKKTSQVLSPLASRRHPEFAHLTDAQVQQQLAELDAKEIDDSDEAAMAAIERQIFLLDDELCARGL